MHLSRFKHRGLGIRPRGLNFTSGNGTILTIDCAPARWNKNDINYSVGHSGYIVFNFMQMEGETSKVDIATKKSFIMTPKSMDVIMDLELDRPYDEEKDSEAEIAFYRPQQSSVMGILKIQKLVDREFNFSYCEVGRTSGITGEDTGELVLESEDDQIKSFGDITLKNG